MSKHDDDLREAVGCGVLILSAVGTVLVALSANYPGWRVTAETKLNTLLVVTSPLAIAGCLWILRVALVCVQPIAEWQRERTSDWNHGKPERERAASLRRESVLASQEETRRHRAVQAAIREVERFYRCHAVALSPSCPRSLFAARRRAEITSGMTGSEAWAAARQLIASLQPAIAEFQRRKQEALQCEQSRLTEQRRLEREIRQCQQRIRHLSVSSFAEGLDSELMMLEGRVRELNEALMNVCDSRDRIQLQEKS